MGEGGLKAECVRVCVCVKCVKNEWCDSKLWIILAQSVCCLCHRYED